MRLLVTLCASLALALTSLGAAAAATVPATKPAIETTSNLGKVIATPARLGIYYWQVEKKAGGSIRCTGACAVPRHVKGVMATFGTIKRGKRLQLTVNGLPAYTYEGDTAGVVKCDGVDGWFAVKP